MNVYEFNKGMYSNIPPMQESAIREVLFNYFVKHRATYFLMLNHDIHYYTLFHTNDFCVENMVNEVYSIISELGPIVDIISNEETDMLEIWIRYEEQPLMFGLFDYTRGVVEV